MATATGAQLARNIKEQFEELKKVCEEVDEGIAARNPAGRWSPKEILSHLLGPEEFDHLSMVRTFIDQDNPTIHIEAENPFFTEKRARMTFAQLFSKVETEYGRLAEFATGLSPEELDRQARVPMFKETPLGENPILEIMIGMLCGQEGSHIQFHTSHMREILQELGAPAKK